MIYQFVTESDDQLWVINNWDLTWGKASAIISAPSVAAVESLHANFHCSEQGIIIAMGAGAYSLDGRTPKDGLSEVGFLHVGGLDNLVIFLDANTKIKDKSFQSHFPAFMQPGIHHALTARAKNGPEAVPAQGTATVVKDLKNCLAE